MKVRFSILVMLFAFFATSVVSAQTKTWKVGDIYDVNGKQGVVFAVTPDGQHGKIVSAQCIVATWTDAPSQCASLGSGWRMSTRSELFALYNLQSKLNPILLAIGDPLESWYWTPCERDAERGWLISMYNGDMMDGDKGAKAGVLAVFAF